MDAASPSPSPPALSPAHLESAASLRPRCQSLFANWLASLCNACRQTLHHRHSPTLPGTRAPCHPTPGPKLGSPTPAAHPMCVPRAGDTHTPQWLGVSRDPITLPMGNPFWGAATTMRGTPTAAFGMEDWQGDTSEGHQLQRERQRSPQQSQAQQDPNPGGTVPPSLEGGKGGSGVAWHLATGRGQANGEVISAAGCPQGMLRGCLMEQTQALTFKSRALR